jgi:hypothetical protein
MPNGFPCPNPTCAHEFSAETVQGASTLKCPRCGHVFEFRPTGPPGATSAPVRRPEPPGLTPTLIVPVGVIPPETVRRPPPPATRPAPPPLPAAAKPPVAPAVPLALPVAAADPAAALLEPPPDFLPPARQRRRPPSPRQKTGRLVIAGAAVVVLAALAAGAWLYRQALVGWTGAANEEPSGRAYESIPLNYQFQFPSRRWQRDTRTQVDLKVVVGMRRSEPNAWLAVLTNDYKTRTPQDAEMIDEGVKRLKAFFKDRFEWEQKADVQLAGKRAQRIAFLAEANHVPLVGECYLLAYNGIGYWFVTWAPDADRDAAFDEWDGIRKGFSLLKEREGWKEKQPAVVTVNGTKLPYRFDFTEGVWEKEKEPEAYDAACDLALLGRDMTEPRGTEKTATALVLILPKQADLKAAVAAARAHVLAQQKKVYPDTTLEPVDEKAPPPEEIGNLRGQLLKLKAKNTPDLDHLIYLAVINQPDQLVVIQCECDWRRRTYWEVNFTQLLRHFTLRVN